MADIQTHSPRKHSGHTQPPGSGLSSISETEVSVSVSSSTVAETRDLDTEMTGMQAAMTVAADTDEGSKEGNSKGLSVTTQEKNVGKALGEANTVLDFNRTLAGMDGRDNNNVNTIPSSFTNGEQSLTGQPQSQPEPQSQTLTKQPSLMQPRSQSQPQVKPQPPLAKVSSTSAKLQVNGRSTNNTTQAKSDKPRPHVCTTCNRSFARLEHLKRHERSHTKEKPFECPECTRCFARRDLLLRHQQKLHMNSVSASRGRGRRESSNNGALGNVSRSGVGNLGAGSAAGNMPSGGSNAGPNGGRVRKNSMINGGSGARPRANTISHVDGRAFELMANAAITGASNGNDIRIRNAHAAPPVSGPTGRARHPPRGSGHLRGQISHHSSFSGIAGLPGSGLFNPQPLGVTPEDVQGQNHGLSPAGQQPQHHATASHLPPRQQQHQQARPIHGLAKLDTANIPLDMQGLRTAPIGDGYNSDAAMFDFMSQGVVAGNGTTINPAQLLFDPSSSNGAPLNLIHHETSQQYHNHHHDQHPGGLQNGGAGFQAASAPSTSAFAAMFERQQQQLRQENQNQDQSQTQQQQQQQEEEQQSHGLSFDPMAIDFSGEGTTLPFELFTTAAGSTDPTATLDSNYNMFFEPGTIHKSTVDGSSPSAFSTGSQSGVSGVSDSMFDGSTHTLTTVATNASGSTVADMNAKVPTTTNAGWNQGGNDMLVNNSLSFGIDFSSPFATANVEHDQGRQHIQQQQQQFHQQQQTQQQHQQRHGLQNDTVSPRNLFSQATTQVDTSHFLATSAPPSFILNGLQQHAFPHGLVNSAEFSSINGEVTENITAGSLGHENLFASPPISSANGSVRRMVNQSTLTSGLQHSIGSGGHAFPTSRRYSQTSANYLASENNISPSSIFSIPTVNSSLPSNCDMQRYVIAYIQYFHPHLPFLHIPTMNLDTSEFTDSLRMAMDQQSGSPPNFVNGRACLLLSMAAIGALFEFEVAPSTELFESAKKLIQTYLEQKRKADMNAAFHRATAGAKDELGIGSNDTPNSTISSSQTAAEGQEKPIGHNIPLWLIQAMLLNVIYGHTCGDKAAASIASTHCAALVSLARASELISHVPVENLSAEHVGPYENTNAGEDKSEERLQWLRWKVVEERKRTLFAIFSLASLLLSAYNHAPALMNSEIQLNLPCDEKSWAAQTPQSWMAIRNAQNVQEQEISFSSALTSLLNANQRNRSRSSSSPKQSAQRSSSIEQLDDSELKPSTFGCMVLIHAMHNYIWETRQRHVGRPWTLQETEAMHAHIGPALRAWQCAWKSNPQHSIERQNLSGSGPLSADSIPLLDLAYVRLFVNLSRSKEAFWQRDWELMAEEIARGAEIVEHPGEDVLSPVNGTFNNHASGSTPVSVSAATKALAPARRPSMMMDYGLGDLNLGGSSPSNDYSLPTTNEGEVLTLPELGMMGDSTFPTQTKASLRERHLRRAAFYAADSMFMSDKVGATFAEHTSRELPLQYALCAFDCSQVLAEWVTTVQERTGSYLGILGEDHIELGQVPAIMFLEDEDIKLLGKIKEILGSVEAKMRKHAFSSSVTESLGMSLGTSQAGLNDNQPLSGRRESWECPPSLLSGGYGIKILFSTAYLLDRAAVWPVMKLMARSLEVQGMKMRERVRQSVGRDTGINTTCDIPVI